ncbi:MAG: tRNA epoxyqueuosine(34) reductase QueG [Acidimicrobiales bacterium]|nr:tRNA epoxyqueuosine(34) reductase QueG [Acidimicrobiales bacterium]
MTPPAVELRELAEVAQAAGLAAGLDAVGVASARPFTGTRADLEARRAAGLHGGMAFTFRRPERSTDPAATLPGARSLVVGARHYRRAAPADRERDRGRAGAAPVARVARYAWSDHYRALRVALGVVAEVVRSEGWQARVLVDDNALVDREAAYRAGLGWYGKNTNLLVGDRGSWFVLGSVVTDAPLAPADRPMADGCGACRRCLPACPTGALVAPGVLDARRCLAHLVQAPGPFPREFRVALGDRIYGCDDCQEVCPPNRSDERRHPSRPAGATAEPTVDLLALLGATDDELMARHGRWYIPGRAARYLRRNALVALGNVGRGDDAGVAAALAGALSDDDPLVRAHAVWAARRLGRDDLVAAALVEETDGAVLGELAAAVERRS